MIDRDEGEKDLSNVRAQISVIEQENNKITPPQEVPAETAEEEA